MKFMPDDIPPNGRRLFIGYRGTHNAQNVVIQLLPHGIPFEHELYNGIHYLYFQRQKDLRKARELAAPVYNEVMEAV
jgi:hypothetical protein